MGKKVLSVRIDSKIRKQVYTDVNSNAYIVEKALRQFYREKEPNEKLFTNVYDSKIVDSLQKQVDFLQEQVGFLQKQNAFLSLPWYKKMVHQLESKK